MRRLRTSGDMRELIFEITGEELDAPAAEIYSGPEWAAADRGTVAMAVLIVARLQQDEIAALIDEAVGLARKSNRTWDEIGRALKISRQAAQKRFFGGKA